MKALIFAAGEGKRMRPLTLERPKPLLEVLGKPLIEHVLAVLPEEVGEVVMVIGYKGEMIRQRLGAEFAGRKITYVEQKEQLGTGHALMACREFLSPEEMFLVIYADDMHDNETIARVMRKGQPTIFVARVEDPRQFGTIVVGARGTAADINEKSERPRSDLVATGAYLLDAGIFEHEPRLELNGEYYINSMLIPYMHERDVFVEIENFWIPIGYPEDLKRAEAILAGRATGTE